MEPQPLNDNPIQIQTFTAIRRVVDILDSVFAAHRVRDSADSKLLSICDERTGTEERGKIGATATE